MYPHMLETYISYNNNYATEYYQKGKEYIYTKKDDGIDIPVIVVSPDIAVLE